MLIKRAVTFVCFVVLAGCGGGGASLTSPRSPNAPAGPAAASSRSVVNLGPDAQRAALPTIGTIGGTLSLPKSNAPRGAILTITARPTGSNGALPQGVRRDGAGTLNVYAAYEFVASADVTYDTSPQFAITLPDSIAAIAQDLYVAVSQPGSADALLTLRTEGPATRSGTTAIVGSDQTPIVFEAGKPYLFTLYGTSPAAASFAYVVDGTSIKAFPARGRGDIAPTRTIAGSNTGLTDVAALAVDTQGQVYVANRGADPTTSSIRVFAHNADGNVAPVRVIAGPSTTLYSVNAVSVDADGRAYVGQINAKSQGSTREGDVVRFAPGADGDSTPEASFSLADVKSITFDSTGENLIISSFYNRSSVFSATITTLPRRFTSTSAIVRQIVRIGGADVVDDPSSRTFYYAGGQRFEESAAGLFGAENGEPAPATRASFRLACAGNSLAIDDLRDLVATGTQAPSCERAAINFYDANPSGDVRPIGTIAGPATTLVAPTRIAIGT
ncbi:MAG: hypothetical protein NVS4B5_05290 [Vulcanimicrobiaceae bacterium]